MITPGGLCEWSHNTGNENCPAPADVALTSPDGTPGGHFCIPHAIRLNKHAEQIGEAPTWTVLNPSPSAAIEGAPAVSAPAAPTGEIQGKADTEKALQGYRGLVTTYQDDLAVLHSEGGQMQAMANRLCEQLIASELGDHTRGAVAAVQENAGCFARLTAKVGPAAEAVLAALSEFDAAVAAHDAVEAAALANNDGGTTEFHNDGDPGTGEGRTGGYINNLR